MTPRVGSAMASYAPISRDVLGCLVAGFEKGGTTLVKDLIRHACRMRGCFEGGLLLADSPSDGIPEPYGTQLVASWALPPNFLEEVRGCRSFEEAYRLLRDRSEHVIHKHRPLIDKTPRYMMDLEGVLRRAPTTPIVVVIRDPTLVAESWARLGQRPAAAAEAIQRSAAGLATVAGSGIGSERVYVLRLDDLTAEPQAALDAVAAWLGYPPRPHDPTMLLGTPEASGHHAPGIDPQRGTSSRVDARALRTAIDHELGSAGPEIAWARQLVTGPLAASSGP
jgi:hypothetical protein